MRGVEVPGRRDGQASVELVAMLPLVLGVGLAVLQLLAAGVVAVLADHGAQAGAMAILQGQAPATAVRQALPGWSHDRVQVRVAGRAVHVRLSPPAVLPAVSRLLSTEATADAGPGRR